MADIVIPTIEIGNYCNYIKLAINPVTGYVHRLTFNSTKYLQERYRIYLISQSFGVYSNYLSTEQKSIMESDQYLHPVIILTYSMWLSPRLYLAIFMGMCDFFAKSEANRKLFRQIFREWNSYNLLTLETIGGENFSLDPTSSKLF